MGGAWEGEANREDIREFLKMLAVCHTVLPEGGETIDTIMYQVRYFSAFQVICYMH